MATKKRRAPKRAAPKRRTTSRRRRAPARRAPFNVGDDVKLIFEPDTPIPGGPAGERMWVRVTSIRGKHASGYLNDTPLFLRGIRHRSRVGFAVSQVIQVIRN